MQRYKCFVQEMYGVLFVETLGKLSMLMLSVANFGLKGLQLCHQATYLVERQIFLSCYTLSAAKGMKNISR